MIVGWISCDSRGPASIYLASDSRFSWGGNSFYDYGKKLFALKYTPDILAYCGEVLYPMCTISQIATLAEEGLLFPSNSTSLYRSDIIFNQLKIQFTTYNSVIPINIYHISRCIDNKFYCYRYSWNSSNGWDKQIVNTNYDISSVLFSDGSGKIEFDKKYCDYNCGDLKNTSRNVFHCFNDTLKHISDRCCGGSPQLVGLYRSKYNGINFGVIYDNKKYCHGAPVHDTIHTEEFRWYNSNFEICDPKTLLRKANAMPQPNPNLNSATP